jgi:hypothetical protein
MILPGPDGQLGTGDDEVRSLESFSQEILIADIIRPDGTVDANLRQVTVTIQYPNVRGQILTYQVGTYVSRFR